MDLKKISFLVFIALLAASASASTASGNFSVSCDCIVPAEAQFSLTNDSVNSQTFVISASGPYKDWINANGTWIGSQALSMLLSSNETKNLYAFIKPQTCYTAPGTYEINLNFSSSEENFSKTITVTVTPSRMVTVDISPSTVELRQCEQSTINATIANTGKSDEIINLSISEIPKTWYELSQETFLLEKGASRQMAIALKPECGAEAKEYGFTLNAAVQNTSFKTGKQFALKIIDAQQIELSSGALNACIDKETTAQAKIKNNGRLADSLELSASGLDWASISPGSIDLNTNEEKNLAIKFKKNSSNAKDYTFKIKAHSTKFAKDTEKEFTVSLKDCYGITIGNAKANGSTDAIPSVCLEEPLSYEFEIINDKAEAIQVDASLRNINATTSPSKATISPGQKQVFTAQIDLSNEKAGDKNFELAINSQYFSTSKTFSFKAIDCYSLQVDYDGLNAPIDVNASNSAGNRANPFTVKVKNTGTKTNTVNAAVDGANWVYFQPNSFPLNAGEERGIYLYIDPPYDTKHANYNSTLKITAQFFSDSKRISTNVYGGLYEALGTADVSAEGEFSSVSEQVEKTMEINVIIRNDSNAFIKIQDLNALGYNSRFSFAAQSLAPEQSIIAKMTLFLSKDFNEQKFTVPVKISTDKGAIIRDVQIDLNAPKKTPPGTIVLSLASLGGIKNVLLVAIIAIVIALLIIFIFKRATGEKTPQEEKQAELESYWKAPEEKETHKNLESIAKEVKKKPSRTKKKASRKK